MRSQNGSRREYLNTDRNICMKKKKDRKEEQTKISEYQSKYLQGGKKNHEEDKRKYPKNN